MLFRRTLLPVIAIAVLIAAAYASTEKVIHNFNPTPNGYFPGALVADQSGNLYGTARGGTYDAGILYKVSQNSKGKWTQTVLYNFPGGTGAYAPNYVAFDAAGSLYGFAYLGGTSGQGTAVKLSQNAQGVWSATVLYNFFDLPYDVGESIAIDASGNLYGIYTSGANQEALFQLAPTSNGTWIKTVVYTFKSPSDGDYVNGLNIDAHGNIYGVTESGGTAGCKCGSVFELTPTSSGTWTHTILYSFTGNKTLGSPLSLTFDASGNMFGTTEFGPIGGNCIYEGDGCGGVFELQPGSNGQWTETTLYNFETESTSVFPSTLVIDSQGNLYGTTYYGGPTSQTCYQGCGTVFEVSPSGNGQWTATTLYDFQGGSDGYEPSLFFGLVLVGGNLYGTTMAGGTTNLSGTVFSLTPQGSSSQLNTIYSFSFSDGNLPSTGLVGDGNGNLFGTGFGGAHDEGSVFEMSPTSSGGWTEKLIYSFSGSYAGSSVGLSALISDPFGNFYGTTVYSAAGYGTVFELSPSSSGTWTATTLYSFTGAGDGASPQAGLVFDSSGNLYGTTHDGGSKNLGTIFELSRQSNGQWKKTVRYNFVGAPFDGEFPAASLIMDQAGNFYGTTTAGGSSTNCGSSGCGTVFEFSPSAKSEKVLYSFQGLANDGSDPSTSLIFDDAGNLFGTTFEGGIAHCHSNNAPSCGVVFELSPTGNSAWKETVVHRFANSTTDGGNPTSSLILDAAGNFYGTTAVGGTSGHGTVFKLAPATGNWTYSVAYNFQNTPDGSYPAGNLWLDPSGTLYGVTGLGGQAFSYFTNGYGTVYQFTP